MEMIMSTSTMTGAPIAAPRIARRSWSEWLVAALKAWWLARMERRLERLAILQLRAMSDRELKDIGICRSQIEFDVRVGRDRDRALSRYI